MLPDDLILSLKECLNPLELVPLVLVCKNYHQMFKLDLIYLKNKYNNICEIMIKFQGIPGDLPLSDQTVEVQSDYIRNNKFDLPLDCLLFFKAYLVYPNNILLFMNNISQESSRFINYFVSINHYLILYILGQEYCVMTHYIGESNQDHVKKMNFVSALDCLYKKIAKIQ